MMYFEELEKKGLTDKLCEYCRNYITDEISGGNGWLCEGFYCDSAEDSFLTYDKDGVNFYRKLKLENLKINNLNKNNYE